MNKTTCAIRSDDGKHDKIASLEELFEYLQKNPEKALYAYLFKEKNEISVDLLADYSYAKTL